MPHVTTSAIVREDDKSKNQLYELALDLLKSKVQFTDLHVESNQPAMVRRSACDWTEVTDLAGDPITITHRTITLFLDGLFNAQASIDGTSTGGADWRSDLNAADSLHPAINLSERSSDGESIVSFRVRCTIQKQLMGEAIGMVLRPLREIPVSIESLGLPIQASQLLEASSRGLIVITGPTASGKSTTLAAMLNEINEHKRANILTIEDPVEFVHRRKRSIINQRELGVDIKSYASGVRDALRLAPDVILIGEIRDAQTMQAAVRAGESGHLVLTTMHAPTAVTAFRKMVAYFEGSQADSQALAACLVGIVAQALIRDVSGTKNHLACEVLNCRDSKANDAIAVCVADQSGKKFLELENAVRADTMGHATIPMIRSLKDLVSKGLIDKRAAASVAWHAEEKSELLKMNR